jgi:hypothetical protein
MKRICVALVVGMAFVLTFCTSSRNAKKKVPKITYMANVQPIMVANCSPCHMPPEGNKKPYNTYALVKDDVDEIIRRVSLNPGERGFMPMRHPKLSDSTINVFVQWKADGLLEK